MQMKLFLSVLKNIYSQPPTTTTFNEKKVNILPTFIHINNGKYFLSLKKCRQISRKRRRVSLNNGWMMPLQRQWMKFDKYRNLYYLMMMDRYFDVDTCVEFSKKIIWGLWSIIKEFLVLLLTWWHAEHNLQRLAWHFKIVGVFKFNIFIVVVILNMRSSVYSIEFIQERNL